MRTYRTFEEFERDELNGGTNLDEVFGELSVEELDFEQGGDRPRRRRREDDE
jgi:hypothetical protein